MFHHPDLYSTIYFLLIVFYVFYAVFWALAKSIGERAKPKTILTLMGSWLMLISLVVASGILEKLPFAVLLIFGASNGIAVLLGCSSIGKDVSQQISLPLLVGFQVFRLPLELVLHSWGEQGTIPMAMTYNGQNFDIISGVAALVLAPLAGRYRAAAWLANVIGIILLVNVARVAVTNSPLPFWPMPAEPLLLGYYLPYVWIVPVCVAGALFGHIVLTRRLLLN